MSLPFPAPQPVAGAGSAYLWDAHLRQQVALVPDNVVERARSAERLDELFFHLVTILQPSAFVEAGAFEGTTSLRVKGMLPEARVVAFEANPDTHERFSALHDYAGVGVDYRCLALTDTAGQVVFHREDQSDPLRAGSSSLLDRNRSGDVWVPETRTTEATVEGITLDMALGATEGRAALWIDVEGAARQVLGGADQLLDSCDLMKIEVEDAPYWADQWCTHDVLSLLLDRGFIPIARDAEYPHQFNVLLVRPVLARNPGTLSELDDFLRPTPTSRATRTPRQVVRDSVRKARSLASSMAASSR